MNIMNKYIFLIILIISSTVYSSYAKSEAEMSSKIENPEKHKIFITRLEEKGIKFHVSEDRQVFYPVSKREEVHKIFMSVLSINVPAPQGAIVKLSQAPYLAAELVKAQIQFEVMYQDGKSFFKWPAHLNEKAITVVNKVLKEHGV